MNSRSDNSLFVYHHGNNMAYLLLYVDDIILTCSSDTLHKSIIDLLSSEFEMKDLGPLHYFLGIDVTRHTGGLSYSSPSANMPKILLRGLAWPLVSHLRHQLTLSQK